MLIGNTGRGPGRGAGLDSDDNQIHREHSANRETHTQQGTRSGAIDDDLLLNKSGLTFIKGKLSTLINEELSTLI